MSRPVTLADIEAAIRHRLGARDADVAAIRSMVTAYAETEGLALARDRVLQQRRAALMSAGPASPISPVLREAHAEVTRLREMDLPVPVRLAALARQYERDRKRAQRQGVRAKSAARGRAA